MGSESWLQLLVWNRQWQWELVGDEKKTLMIRLGTFLKIWKVYFFLGVLAQFGTSAQTLGIISCNCREYMKDFNKEFIAREMKCSSRWNHPITVHHIATGWMLCSSKYESSHKFLENVCTGNYARLGVPNEYSLVHLQSHSLCSLFWRIF